MIGTEISISDTAFFEDGGEGRCVFCRHCYNGCGEESDEEGEDGWDMHFCWEREEGVG